MQLYTTLKPLRDTWMGMQNSRSQNIFTDRTNNNAFTGYKNHKSTVFGALLLITIIVLIMVLFPGASSQILVSSRCLLPVVHTFYSRHPSCGF